MFADDSGDVGLPHRECQYHAECMVRAPIGGIGNLANHEVSARLKGDGKPHLPTREKVTDAPHRSGRRKTLLTRLEPGNEVAHRASVREAKKVGLMGLGAAILDPNGVVPRRDRTREPEAYSLRVMTRSSEGAERTAGESKTRKSCTIPRRRWSPFQHTMA